MLTYLKNSGLREEKESKGEAQRVLSSPFMRSYHVVILDSNRYGRIQGETGQDRNATNSQAR